MIHRCQYRCHLQSFQWLFVPHSDDRTSLAGSRPWRRVSTFIITVVNLRHDHSFSPPLQRRCHARPGGYVSQENRPASVVAGSNRHVKVAVTTWYARPDQLTADGRRSLPGPEHSVHHRCITSLYHCCWPLILLLACCTADGFFCSHLVNAWGASDVTGTELYLSPPRDHPTPTAPRPSPRTL